MTIAIKNCLQILNKTFVFSVVWDSFREETLMGSQRTDLPHVIQKFEWDCGVACTQMILLKLGEIFDESALYDVEATLAAGENIWTIDLANILRQFNIDCIYYTITCGVHPGYKDEAFYRDVFNTDETRVNSLFEKAEEMRINIIKRSITMDEILSKLGDGYVAIVLINSNLLICNSCEQKYLKEDSILPCIHSISNDEDNKIQFAGHYIVLCGFDTEAGVLFYKNPSLKDSECCVKIPSFEKARKSYGTDEDIIFVNIKK